MDRIATPKDFLQSLSAENARFYADDRGRGALRDLEQTFPNRWLYIAELLQNAVDERATRVQLRVEDGQRLVFEHDGREFSWSDVQAICQRGVSGKGPTTVGFMGIGFKAVFRSFTDARVSSGPWKFAFRVPVVKKPRYGDQQRDWVGAVLPEWDDDAGKPSDGMTCRFELAGRLEDLEPIDEDIAHVLGEDLSLLALLARRGIRQFSFGATTWSLSQSVTSFTSPGGERAILEARRSDGGATRSWVLFSIEYVPSASAIRRFLEHRQINPRPDEEERLYAEAQRARRVEGFCALDASGQPLPPTPGFAFALLPTGVPVPLGVHIQADWLLVTSRRAFMEADGNDWHAEILHQIPRLLRHYLEWLVEEQRRRNVTWPVAYGIVQRDSSSGSPLSAWFQGREFGDLLRRELMELPFLPAPGDHRQLRFLAPSTGRVLPSSLADEFDDGSLGLRTLFGDHVVSTPLLGQQNVLALAALGLLEEVDPSDLAGYWKDGHVEQWLHFTEEPKRDTLLVRLLAALAALDQRDEWRNAPLVCLPTERGSWGHRGAVRRLPADWNVLAQEPNLQALLKPFVGEDDVIVRWSFDSLLARSRSSGAQVYLDRVKSPVLERVVASWWESLPRRPTEAQAEHALYLTAWVRAKQKERTGLIKKLLCTDETELCLVPVGEALLAEPYAGRFRKRFHTAMPVVSTRYAEADPTSTEADWRSFFESMDLRPKGRFGLRVSGRIMGRWQLREELGQDLEIPDCRSSFITPVPWRGTRVQNLSYTVIDADLPESLIDRLAAPIDGDLSTDLAAWLAETPGQLRELAQMRLAYIPYGAGRPTERVLERESTWVHRLRQAAWVYSTHGKGPFPPCDVLARFDLSRPEAPTANIPETLVQILERAAIQFGTAIPNAPALDRLRARAETGSPTELVGLLRDAVAEAEGDEAKTALLEQVLRERPLVPVADLIKTIDGAARIPFVRLVWSSRGRSSLGGWLVAIDQFPSSSPERVLCEAIADLRMVPHSATGSQAVDFLEWVWAQRPEAHRVRQVLPMAYQYVREAIEIEPDFAARLRGSLPRAVVFLQRQRRWAPVADNADLFFDDMAHPALRNLLGQLQIATPGHFGGTPREQLETARLLCINLLSSRFRVDTRVHDAEGLPSTWAVGFSLVQDLLRQRLYAKADEDEEPRSVDTKELRLSRWRRLETVVYDRGVVVESHEPLAADRGTDVAVTGQPRDFAEALGQILCQRWGLAARRDLLDFAVVVGTRLAQLNDAEAIATWRHEQQAQIDVVTSMAIPASRVGSEPAPEEDEAAGSHSVGATDHHTTEQAGELYEAARDGHPIREDDEALQIEEEALSAASHAGRRPRTGAGAGGSYDAEHREARLESLQRRKAGLEAEIRALINLGVLPAPEEDSEANEQTQPRTDDDYRQAVLDYERQHGRWPVAKGSTQPGHDIDSFTHPEGHQDRRLIRRIEVKGRGTVWEGAETVEMSPIQFTSARDRVVEPDLATADDFDYWLYVVERDDAGPPKVLAIRNPARSAGHFELRGGTWRFLADCGEPTDS